MTEAIRCPKCGSKTHLRTSKQDGSKFHVCSRYPDCRGKVAFEDDWEDDWEEEKPVERRPVERRPREYRERPSGERRTSGISIAAMVCGICALVFPWFGFLMGLLSVVFGGVGISQTGKNPNLGGRGMAIAGLVCGIIGIAFWAVILFVIWTPFWVASTVTYW